MSRCHLWHPSVSALLVKVHGLRLVLWVWYVFILVRGLSADRCRSYCLHDRTQSQSCPPLDKREDLRACHVGVPCCPSLLFPDLSSSLTTSYPAMPVELPAELVQRVLDFLVKNEPDYYHGPRHMYRKNIARCARTCRYWAQRCRSELFACLTLKRARDAEQLLTFLRDTKSDVGIYIRTLTLYPVIAEPPWIHLVPIRVLPLCPSREEAEPPTIHLSFSCPRFMRPCKSCLGPSVYATLPRQGVPSTLFLPVRSLTLCRLDFNGYSQLSHLIADFPLLRSLELEIVNWVSKKKGSATSDQVALPPTRRPPLCLNHILCEHVASAHLVVPFCFGFMHARPEEYPQLLRADTARNLEAKPRWDRARAPAEILHQTQFVTLVQCISSGIWAEVKYVGKITEEFHVVAKGNTISESVRFWQTVHSWLTR